MESRWDSFGIGVMAARQLWLVGHWPYPLAFLVGGIAATLFALVIGVPTFRLRGAYFSIGTLGLAEALRISVGNVFPNINALPAQWFADVPRGAATVALRPEDVEVAAPDGGDLLHGTVLECSLPKHQLVAEHAGVEIRARLPRTHTIAAGQRVAFRFPPARRLYFDRDGLRVAASDGPSGGTR